LHAIACELNKIGGDVEELEDSLIIRGNKKLKGGVVDSWNDHRIAMALAVASIACEEPLIINNSEAVEKSYPNFWKEFTNVGGNIIYDMKIKL
jgi:3-phosphoshikimate 1-carboxyvinyltransferase